jgi:hypothetical protein
LWARTVRRAGLPDAGADKGADHTARSYERASTRESPLVGHADDGTQRP